MIFNVAFLNIYLLDELQTQNELNIALQIVSCFEVVQLIQELQSFIE
jgi:hypothetical protein